ncbi:MAG: kelch repeat-containing protein, partial [Acidobacteriota bacterium]
MRDQFPSVDLESRATLGAAQELVAGRMVSGFQAERAPQQVDALRVLYPDSYDGTFVAELGEQRIALRAVGARFSAALVSNGKIFYSGPHDSVEVIEVPGTGRSEELLVLHTARAPRVFEYEIVERRGVAGMTVSNGAIRFVPDVELPAVAQIASGRFTTPPRSLQIDRPWVIDAVGRRSETAAQWTIVEAEGQAAKLRLTIDADSLVYPLVVDPSFSATGTMTTARVNHTATLLPNGKVLIAGGGSGAGASLNTAELYDPATGTFALTGTMTGQRSFHTATLLLNGKVLIAGGYDGADPARLNTAELYDPVTGTFAATTGIMNSTRQLHTATLLQSGKVLIAGGMTAGLASLNTADVYDPVANTFTATATMSSARNAHTATL